MASQSSVGKAILIGIIITTVGAVVSLAFPNSPNYLLLPGILLVYVASGGVHGDSRGVHLPSLTVWYALGGIIDLFVYSLMAFLALRVLKRRRDKVSL